MTNKGNPRPDRCPECGTNEIAFIRPCPPWLRCENAWHVPEREAFIGEINRMLRQARSSHLVGLSHDRCIALDAKLAPEVFRESFGEQSALEPEGTAALIAAAFQRCSEDGCTGAFPAQCPDVTADVSGWCAQHLLESVAKDLAARSAEAERQCAALSTLHAERDRLRKERERVLKTARHFRIEDEVRHGLTNGSETSKVLRSFEAAAALRVELLKTEAAREAAEQALTALWEQLEAIKASQADVYQMWCEAGAEAAALREERERMRQALETATPVVEERNYSGLNGWHSCVLCHEGASLAHPVEHSPDCIIALLASLPAAGTPAQEK